MKTNPVKTVLNQSISDSEIFSAAASLSPTIAVLQKRSADGSFLHFSEISSIKLQRYAATNEEETSAIVTLPEEILQKIFAYIPIRQLVVNVAPVCQRFKTIISNKNFLKWSKLYEVYRSDGQKAFDHLDHSFTSVLLKGRPGKGLLNLIDEISSFLPSKLWCQETAAVLKCHRLFTQAYVYFERTKHTSLWSFLTIAVIIADSVSLISHLLDIVLSISFLSVHDVLEYFHLLALCLLVLQQRHHLSPLLHYNVMYSLNLFYRWEPTSIVGMQPVLHSRSNGQQSMHTYAKLKDDLLTRLTDEQLRIINSNFGPGDTVRILAFAGTGKTTVLQNYVRLRPTMRFLVVFYNKSICENARAKFSPNACCRTIHSLAYQGVGVRYKGKLGASLSLMDIVSSIGKLRGLNPFITASQVKQTLQNYFASNDEHITTAHTPKQWQTDSGVQSLDIDHQLRIIKYTETVWAAMKKPTDKQIHMLHDGYLKMYQLMNPVLDYDCIMVDEAQDCNPATVDIIIRQKCPKIFVGDSYQQIYGFRGAIDALKTIRCTHTFYLTRSFRFGPEIAFVVNCWLHAMCGEESKYVVGTDKPSFVDGSCKGQVAVIARNNATVFDECARISGMSPTPRLMISGSQNFGFNMIEDIYTLMLSKESRAAEHRTIKNPFIARFTSLAELEATAMKTMDAALMSRIKIVRKYEFAIPRLIQRIHSCLVSDPTTANFIVSTAHQSKGLEFTNVRLTEDYLLGDDCDNRVHGDGTFMSLNECNLVYVAMSRAKQSLVINREVLSILNSRCSELFESIVFDPSTYGPLKDLPLLTCVQCHREIENGEGCLYERRVAFIRTEHVDLLEDGPRCLTCAFATTNDKKITYQKFTPSVQKLVLVGGQQKRRHFKELFSAGSFLRKY